MLYQTIPSFLVRYAGVRHNWLKAFFYSLEHLAKTTALPEKKFNRFEPHAGKAELRIIN